MKKFAGNQANPQNEDMVKQLKGYLEVSKQQLQQLAVNKTPVTPKRKHSDLDSDPLKGNIMAQQLHVNDRTSLMKISC